MSREQEDWNAGPATLSPGHTKGGRHPRSRSIPVDHELEKEPVWLVAQILVEEGRKGGQSVGPDRDLSGRSVFIGGPGQD
jgi:hypothetical protein